MHGFVTYDHPTERLQIVACSSFAKDGFLTAERYGEHLRQSQDCTRRHDWVGFQVEKAEHVAHGERASRSRRRLDEDFLVGKVLEAGLAALTV